MYFYASLIIPRPNRITSSTNSRWNRFKDLPVSIIFRAPSLLNYLTILLRHFVTKRKRKGDMGKPSLKPLVGLKNLDADPFIRREKETKDGWPII